MDSSRAPSAAFLSALEQLLGPPDPAPPPPITEHALVRRLPRRPARFVPAQPEPVGTVCEINGVGKARVHWQSGPVRFTTLPLHRLVLVAPASACRCGCQDRSAAQRSR